MDRYTMFIDWDTQYRRCFTQVTIKFPVELFISTIKLILEIKLKSKWTRTAKKSWKIKTVKFQKFYYIILRHATVIATIRH